MLGPFGYGKRSCPGQAIAELQILLYTVNLLRYVYEKINDKERYLVSLHHCDRIELGNTVSHVSQGNSKCSDTCPDYVTVALFRRCNIKMDPKYPLLNPKTEEEWFSLFSRRPTYAPQGAFMVLKNLRITVSEREK